jgi:hypothetical protein
LAPRSQADYLRECLAQNSSDADFFALMDRLAQVNLS